MCPSLGDPMDWSPPDSSVHGDSPGKNTGVGCHALFQRIFPTQGLNPGLLHCWRILYILSHQGSSCSPVPGGLFLPLVEKHQTMNVLWESIFFIHRTIITVDSVYKITCQGHFTQQCDPIFLLYRTLANKNLISKFFLANLTLH